MQEVDQRLAVLEIAITSLGQLALAQRKKKLLTSAEVYAAIDSLVDCLEVLNDEKETYSGTS